MRKDLIAGIKAKANILDDLVSQINLPRETQRALLRAAMNSVGTGKVAHHLIPLEAISKFKSLMVKAARGGFNINGANNGILLSAAEHVYSHPGYNKIVMDELNRINNDVIGRGLSDAAAAALLKKAADTLRKAAQNRLFYPSF